MLLHNFLENSYSFLATKDHNFAEESMVEANGIVGEVVDEGLEDVQLLGVAIQNVIDQLMAIGVYFLGLLLGQV